MENIKQFLQRYYSDAALYRLLEAAEAGELRAMDSRRCLLGMSDFGYEFHHHFTGFLKPSIFSSSITREAEWEFMNLATRWKFGKKAGRKLSVAMLPIINEEINCRGLSTLKQEEAAYQVRER